MSGLALFGLKYPARLPFEHDRREATTRANLKALYRVERAPSDTRLRERVDELEPGHLRPLDTALFGQLPRGKGLEGFDYLDGHDLLWIDGTGDFSSQQVHCAQKHHCNGTTTCYHPMLGAALVHPDHTEVVALVPEPILKSDGAKRNDCERNAAKPLLSDRRREHPHLKLIVVEDGLACHAAHIRHLQALDLRFILGAKPSDHRLLFAWVAATPATTETTLTDRQGFRHRFRYPNNAPSNDASFDPAVHFLAHWKHAPDGTLTHFAWVRDIPTNEHNLMTLMRGARARCKIENETFNTLKNQGDHFEHNLGHGPPHLRTVLMRLMMLAFLIDQIQQRGCRLLQVAVAAAKSKTRLRCKLPTRFDLCLIPDWETLDRSSSAPPPIASVHDTSQPTNLIDRARCAS